MHTFTTRAEVLGGGQAEGETARTTGGLSMSWQ